MMDRNTTEDRRRQWAERAHAAAMADPILAAWIRKTEKVGSL